MRVRFYARGHVRGYQCRLDSGKFRACRSLGRYQPAEKLAKKRELIGEIIAFFDL